MAQAKLRQAAALAWPYPWPGALDSTQSLCGTVGGAYPAHWVHFLLAEEDLARIKAEESCWEPGEGPTKAVTP